MNDLLYTLGGFLILFGILCASAGICVYRDIQRWKAGKARRNLGTVINRC